MDNLRPIIISIFNCFLQFSHFVCYRRIYGDLPDALQLAEFLKHKKAAGKIPQHVMQSVM